MHILYLDDSGSINNASEDYIVLGGVSVSEHQCQSLTYALDKIAQSIDPASFHDIEFHASEIFSRRRFPWDKLNRSEAQEFIKEVLRVVLNAHESVKVFGCAIHKKSFPDRNNMNEAFVDLCQRFDDYLQRLCSTGDNQKGLLIIDDQATLKQLAKSFRQTGTPHVPIRHLADTPIFVNSKSSRIIQIADHIAYSIFRRYNHSDTHYFDIIASRFHSIGHAIQGLEHKQKINPHCMCPACHSRRF